MRRVFFILLILAAQGCSSKADRPTKGAMPAETASVLVAHATKKDVPIEIQAVGTVEASATVTVKSQMSGELMQVLFREGDFVKKGDEIFKVDSRTYEAQVNQAQANLAKDEATLAQIEANLARDLAQQKYAQAEAARNTSLYEKRLVSKEQAEQSSAGADAAAAVVRADQAAIQSARASMDATKASIANARVLLSYTSIRSPLSGRTGDILIQQGNLVGPSTNLTIINQVEPIYVGFSIPQNQLSSVKKGQSVLIKKQDGSSATEEAKLFFIDNAVDPATGSILVKAAVTNKAHTLWPGEFVRVVLRLGMKKDALIIPSQAVQTGQAGPFVFVVKSDGKDEKVESRPVVPGMRVDGDVVIEQGLMLGETIVTEGQLRLGPTSNVKIR
jgi:multidrug efflux system membrane fusion protein